MEEGWRRMWRRRRRRLLRRRQRRSQKSLSWSWRRSSQRKDLESGEGK
jgi:hypothetical protein